MFSRGKQHETYGPVFDFFCEGARCRRESVHAFACRHAGKSQLQHPGILGKLPLNLIKTRVVGCKHWFKVRFVALSLLNQI